jgi:malate dehydrogenase (oxaloacetate-decarboxylating)(NADP+)
MKPIFSVAKRAKRKRIAYAEGEDERVLRAVQVVVDEGLARPTLVGRPASSSSASTSSACAAGRARLRHRQHRERPALPRLLADLPPLTERKGVTEQLAKIEMRRRLTLIGAMLLHKGEVDGLICGTWGSHRAAPALHRPGDRPRPGVNTYACMNGLMLPGRRCSWWTPTSTTTPRPSSWRDHHPGGRGDAALRPAPKAALLSHSNFGSSNQPSAVKMRDALALLQQRRPGWRSTARCTATPRWTRPTAPS